MLATKLVDLSFVFGIHMVEGERNESLKCILLMHTQDICLKLSVNPKEPSYT